MMPHSKTERVLVVIWLSIWLGLLAFSYIQQHIHDMPVALLWLEILFSLPAGIIVAFVLGPILSPSNVFGIEYHPFWDNVPLLLVLSLTSYIQLVLWAPKVIKAVFGRTKNDT